MRRINSGIALAMCVAMGLSAAGVESQSTQAGKSGPRTVMDRAHEIALARSAAPAASAADATIVIWDGEDYETAVEGSNGVTCWVSRSWTDSVEPHCFDEEGSRTILPMHMHRMKRQHQGWSMERIDTEIGEGLTDGTFRLPTRPAMSWMMSAGQHLIGDDGNVAGAWQPHLMIYFPWLTAEGMGFGSTPSLDAGMVVDPGTPFSNIMIVVRDFVPVGSERE